jgi:tRNA-binding protein
LATVDELLALDLRVGTIVASQTLRGARRALYALTLDFGELGRRQAAVDAAGRESATALVGLQVAAVVNLPPRRVAGFESQVLVLELGDGRGESVLLLPERPLRDGTRLGPPEEP